MGLEISDISADILGTASDLREINSQLLNAGWKEVNFGFNLGRYSGALDLQKENKRILVYSSTPEDHQAQILLATHGIPHFRTVVLNPSITVADIPVGARSLDSMRFPDQQPTTGYLGSYDIMQATARLLATIFKKTSHIPQDLRLNQLALIAGKDNPVKLVPPFYLIEAPDWQRLTQDILTDLKLQDPMNNHLNQVSIFEMYFGDALKHD